MTVDIWYFKTRLNYP